MSQRKAFVLRERCPADHPPTWAVLPAHRPGLCRLCNDDKGFRESEFDTREELIAYVKSPPEWGAK
jgi:hypothetical protein